MEQVEEKKTKKQKGYFYQKQEDAFVDYIKATTLRERNQIFNEYLYPAFTKMVESIIRRYNLYIPDEEFSDTFNDTISFLMTKVNNFDETMGHKAYSYCGTICKNYLIGKINNFTKNQQRLTLYDSLANDEYCDNGITSIIDENYEHSEKIIELNELINETKCQILEMIEKKEEFKLNENEVKVGLSLCHLMTNWDELFFDLGSNKFNKSSILFFLKEMTLLSTKEIRDGMKKYKSVYYFIKKNNL